MQGEAHQRVGAVAERHVNVDPFAVEAVEQERLHLLAEGRAVAVLRDGDDDGDRPGEALGAQHDPGGVVLLGVEEPGQGLVQLVDLGLEQLVLRQGLEQGDHRQLVVRALDDVLALEDVLELAAQHRGGRRRLRVALAREQPEEAELADDLPVGVEALHPDVVHAGAPVHRAQPVRA